MKRKLILLLACCMYSIFAWSQTRTVSGTVTASDTRKPVAGATISEKGGKLSARSDEQGKFTLAITDSITHLLVSNVGYSSLEVPLNGETNFNIKLEPSNQVLDDVVV